MAEITTKLGKPQLRLDLTPMVDLGFLLITFFVMTTTMQKSKSLSLTMPSDTITPYPTIIGESHSMTILPCKNGYKYYYGSSTADMKFATNSAALRKAIIDKKAQVQQLIDEKALAPHQQLFAIIKPSNTSNFGALVDVLDEMEINMVDNYAIADPTVSEMQYLQ
ncbi:MAG: hypothetical protein RL660_1963 [Bacteroidota bacterium]|jgi:biopolymer transport protein ExbD